MVKLPKIVQKDKMHKLLNRFNWTNSSIKLTWLNNQTFNSETAEIAQSISNGLSR